jgi:4-diphosphocytidyl-2-C-methyl-D-erythritol kinase
MRDLRERAPAKVNLTLHILGRRPDGYHELESLVAFAGAGDALRLEPDTGPGAGPTLAVEGPEAAVCGALADNLVLKADRLLREAMPGLVSGHFSLTKRLPVAAGLGGGSSDAAAALRLIAGLNGLPLDAPSLMQAARRCGSDVLVCLAPRAKMMRGAGERIDAPLALPPLFAVLVNPRVPVATAQVFAALGLAPDAWRSGAPHPDIGGDEAAVVAGLRHCRNDMEPAAIAIAPVIGVVLAQLRALPGCHLARMSGSGATCFGLFESCRAAARAATRLRGAQPAWWIKSTLLR